MGTERFRIKTKRYDTMRKAIPLMIGLFVSVAVLVGCEEHAPEAAAQVETQAEANEAFASETIHVGVIVSDLEESLRFYEEVIGMQRVRSFEIDEDFGRRSGLTGGVPFTVEVLQLGTGETATQWKLMSFGDRAASQENTYIHNHTGMQYITLVVNDLSVAIARLEARDVEMLGETPTPLSDGRHFVLIQDPDETFIELIGPIGP